MEFRVLGPLRAVDVDGVAVRLPSSTQRRLASMLLVHAGHVVAADRLADQLALSGGALRTSISRLRRSLGKEVLVTDGVGYLIRADRFDVNDFEDAVRGSTPAGDPRDRIVRLRSALDLWRGEAYGEFCGEDWARAESRRLAELRAGAQEELSATLIEIGEHSAAIAELEDLLAAAPYRDRPRELVMRALASSGRRVEALRLFQEYRRTLVDEVGTEPSATIVELERVIAVAGSSPRRPDCTLPAPSSSFVGRARELAVLRRLVTDHRLVTLTGAGGIGKSRLAVHVAEELIAAHPGGTWFADLSRVAQPSAVTEEIARSVGAPTVPGGSIDQVAERIDVAGPSLVVLDNAEHVLAGVAVAAGALLERCPGLRILVTSREALDVPGELVWQLPSMNAPPAGSRPDPDDLADFDATMLFVERMRSARPGMVVDADVAAHVASICARLDGLPLALELAAARTRTLQLSWILAGVETAIAILDPAPAGQGRHRSMRASIAWSVDLLERADRDALGRLSVFRSPFTADAAAAVAHTGDVGTVAVLPVLVRLCDKSLVQFDAATGRYRLLETIRQFCVSSLLDHDGWNEVSSHHCDWFARWCLEVGEGRHGIDRAPVLSEMPDVVAAMDWAREHDPDRAMEMCIGLGSIRTTLGHDENLLVTWEWLLGAEGPRRSSQWASAVAALMAAATGARLGVDAIVSEVESELQASDERARGWLARGRAMVPAYCGHLQAAIDHSASIVRRGDDVEASVYLGFSAYMLALGGRLEEAEDWLRQLHEVVRRHSTPFTVDTVGNGFAAELLIAATSGRLAEATAAGHGAVPNDPAFSMTAAAALAQAALATHDRAALDRALAWGRRGTIPILRFLTTELDLYRALADGDPATAALAAEQYWDQATAVPVSRVHRRAVLNVALLLDGRDDVARRATDEAELIASGMVDVPLLDAVVHQSQAQIAYASGRTDDHHRHATALLELADGYGFGVMAIDARELLALALDRTGERAAADRLVVAAESARERIGYRCVMVGRRQERDALWRRVLGD